MKKQSIISAILILVVGSIIGFSVSRCNPMGGDPIQETAELRSSPGEGEFFTGPICGSPENYSFLTNDLNPSVPIGKAQISNTGTEIVVTLEVEPQWYLLFADLAYHYNTDGNDDTKSNEPSKIIRHARYFEDGTTKYRIVVPKEVGNGEENFSLEILASREAQTSPMRKPIRAYVPGMDLNGNQVFTHWLKVCPNGDQPTDDGKE